jgi:hypothetical protein
MNMQRWSRPAGALRVPAYCDNRQRPAAVASNAYPGRRPRIRSGEQRISKAELRAPAVGRWDKFGVKSRRKGSPHVITIRCLAALAAAAMSLAALTACSRASANAAPAPGQTGSSCGITRTGANVPVIIKVSKGPVTCSAAMTAEANYTKIVESGKLTGNGGGAPAAVGNGWTCQGYPTPEVLKTGNASECHTSSTQILAVIDLASASPSQTAS